MTIPMACPSAMGAREGATYGIGDGLRIIPGIDEDGKSPAAVFLRRAMKSGPSSRQPCCSSRSGSEQQQQRGEKGFHRDMS